MNYLDTLLNKKELSTKNKILNFTNLMISSSYKADSIVPVSYKLVSE